MDLMEYQGKELFRQLDVPTTPRGEIATTPDEAQALAERGADDIVVFGGGIVPRDDITALKAQGIAEIFTPGARTDDIIAWVRQHVDDPAQPGSGAA